MILVDALLENLGRLAPVKIIRSYQQGVKFALGDYTGEPLQPGWHWFWPIREQIEVVDCNEDGIDCLVQSITTKADDSGKSAEVTLSFNVFRKVTDAGKLWVGLRDWDHNIERAARRWIHRKVRTWTYQELIGHQTDLESGLKDTLTNRFEKWGIEITDVGLTDLIVAPNWRIHGLNNLLEG